MHQADDWSPQEVLIPSKYSWNILTPQSEGVGGK